MKRDARGLPVTPQYTAGDLPTACRDTIFMHTKTTLLIALLGITGTSSALAQASISDFGVGKKQDFLQISAATPVSHTILADPAGPFHFSATIDGVNLN